MCTFRRILIYGDDARQRALGDFLTKDGVTVLYVVPTNAKSYLKHITREDTGILLPVPCDNSLYQHVNEIATANLCIIGGNIPSTFVTSFKEKGCQVWDYLKNQTIVMQNTVATAEGALCEAIRYSPWTIHQSHCLVLGYGRCGKTLAHRLAGCGSLVTIAARNPLDLAEAETLGYTPLSLPPTYPDTLKPQDTVGPLIRTGAFTDIVTSPTTLYQEDLTHFRFIFNTIPALMLDASLLAKLAPEVTIIDIASGAGGCDYDYCQKHHINAHLCPGLPAKYAPATCAKIIYAQRQRAFL